MLADAGFRTPDGHALRYRSANGRTTAARMVPAPWPGPSEIERVLSAWAGVRT